MRKRKFRFIFESDAVEFQAALTKEGIKSEWFRDYDHILISYYA